MAFRHRCCLFFCGPCLFFRGWCFRERGDGGDGGDGDDGGDGGGEKTSFFLLLSLSLFLSADRGPLRLRRARAGLQAPRKVGEPRGGRARPGEDRGAVPFGRGRKKRGWRRRKRKGRGERRCG